MEIQGTHSGSWHNNLVAHTHNLGTSGDWAPIRQQPWWGMPVSLISLLNQFPTLCKASQTNQYCLFAGQKEK